ncbi:MAG: SMP-30/gluconolactonase/LRE family protein [Burkholderiaceae bacterium]|jgi:gluconolactonase|nr:SMP-30/gluconolactonase/LRE family protein [Burkholderiaceae bacterium]
MTRVVADDLWFPEGPVALEDGSVVLVEIRRQTLTRIAADGSKQIVARLSGGPNGAAIGPDGHCYVCNNGGFEWVERQGILYPGSQPADYSGGRIERVDMNTGKVEVLYTEVDGHPLRGPNDLVFDGQGGFWFTDLGKGRPRDMDRGGLYYARTDGSSVRKAIYPLLTPNGVGLSPDGKTVYVAETQTCRLWAFDLSGPGQIVRAPHPSPNGGRMLYASPVPAWYDSLAVEAGGNVCVATLLQGGISVIAPQGGLVEFIPTPGDWMVTNICFGGPDRKRAFITLSGAGKLIEMDWPRAGLTLAH